MEYKAVDSVPNALAVANSGDGDAFGASGENAQRLEEYGWKPLVSLKDLGLRTYSLYMANQEYLDANKETVVKFIKATQEIMEYVKENVDESAKIMNDKAGLETDIFKNEISRVTFQIDVTQDTYDDLKEIAAWTLENGYCEKEYNIADFLNTDALAEAFPDKVTYTAK